MKNIWLAEEKQALLRTVLLSLSTGQKIDWQVIQKEFSYYSLKQIKDQVYNLLRYRRRQNGYNYHINHTWTKDEENKLISLVEIYSQDWNAIQVFFDSLTIGKLRNKYYSLYRKYSPKATDLINLVLSVINAY